MTSTTKSGKGLAWAALASVLLVGVVLLEAIFLASDLLIPTRLPDEAKSLDPFQLWQPSDLIQAFHAAGLQIEELSLPRDERDGVTTVRVVQSQPFGIPSQSGSPLSRGVILSFQNEKDLQSMQAYYASLGKALPQYDSWVFVKDNLLLEINSDVPEAVAKQYAEALDLLNDR